MVEIFKWKEKRALVTGGLGFIGGSIVESLLDHGSQVDIVDNCSVGKITEAPEGIRNLIIRDLSDVSTFDILPSDYDIVFHFGAPCSIRLFEQDPLAYYQNAFNGSYLIRKFCSDKKIPYLVSASSATVYGKLGNKYDSLDESLPLSPVNIYGLSKCSDELLDSQFPDVKILNARIFVAYGAREYLKKELASTAYTFALNMIRDEEPELWGDGFQDRDFIYIDDLVNLILKASELQLEGSYNFGTGRPTMYIDLIEEYLNKILGKDIEPVKQKNPYGNFYVNSLLANMQKLSKHLGDFYKVRYIEEGLRDMIKEMRGYI